MTGGSDVGTAETVAQSSVKERQPQEAADKKMLFEVAFFFPLTVLGRSTDMIFRVLAPEGCHAQRDVSDTGGISN